VSAGEYLSRLAVALPLVLALLGAAYYAAKRGWLPMLRLTGAAPTGVPPALRLIQTIGLGPGARLVVVEFDGRRLLLAAHRSGISRIDSAAP